MSLTLTWGGVELPNAWYTIHRTQIMGQTGRRIGYTERWDIGGVIQPEVDPGATDSEIAQAVTAEIESLEAALAQDEKDLIHVGTAHALFTAGCLNGTRVVRRPSYPKGNPGIWGSGIEYVGRRSYQCSIEGEILDPDGVVATYHETVQQLSGLVPRFRMVESFTGQAQRQQLVQFPKTVVVQSGMAVGINAYPTAADFLFPNWLMSEPYSVTASEPMKLGVNQNILFPISWRYQFEAPFGFIGVVPPPGGTL